MDDSQSKPNLFERFLQRFGKGIPEDTESILHILRQAHRKNAIDTDTLQRLEKVLAFRDLEVRDVMITRSQMDVVKSSDPLERIIAHISGTAHSRFPVIEHDKDNVLGILHTKDLVRHILQPQHFKLEQTLRPAVFVPEGKSLNALLKEFLEQHNHMAVVVDEYGSISGLVTLEDLIEAILGDIEDEFDEDDGEDNIVAVSEERWRIKATTEIEDINAFFGTEYSSEEADTIGGLIIRQTDYLPVRGEKIALPPLLFTVARADHRRLHTLMAVKTETDGKP